MSVTEELFMPLSIEQIKDQVLSTLTSEERAGSAVYLDTAELTQGTTVEIDRKPIEAPFDSMMAFIDFQPAANWGHRCRYLLVNRATGTTKVFDGSYPPFLKGAQPTLRLVWQGSKVPDWAVAVQR